MFSLDKLLKFSDYHFQGFSDLSFVEFLKYINKLPNNFKFFPHGDFKVKVVESNSFYPIINPNDIETAFKKEDNFLEYQPIPIELSRGCIFRCSFCRHPFQGAKDYDSYQRTSENLAEELRRNYDLFGTTRYTVLDDTINDSMEKLLRLEKAIELSKIPKFQFVGYIKPELLVTKPAMIQKLADLGMRGCYVGIESFKNATRKTIGRGTDIEKVKESLFKLAEVNNNQVLISGSFIVGLPYESPDELLKTHDFMVQHTKSFCRRWVFQPLGIYTNNKIPGEKSIFDSEPEKYNYIVKKDNINDPYYWKNDFFTNKSAKEFSLHLNNLAVGKMYHGGWSVAGAWHLNLSDYEIQNSMLDGFNDKCMDNSINNAKRDYNLLIDQIVSKN